ncbi:RNA polymerase factor sigma-54 [Bacillus sp. FJAT-45066]|uniref:RNA polymerase factor sigma-54 n=1 Tax=Bacillus sp. FJAT-45066 TaxID=2011010 RepID=UPI000BB995C1|nr:RNA polymerase factor sigma-54 [Bacillus sp. FJAT-45066]
MKMKQDVGLYQMQTLKLAMTQELKQAISLLQYSTIELATYIQEQVLENPLLDLKETFTNTHPIRNRTTSINSNEFSIENVSYQGETLHDHIKAQLLDLHLSKQEHATLQAMLDYIDKNGYITEETTFIAKQLRKQEVEVQKAIQTIQNLDPSGIGARNLKECLLLQLKSMDNRELLAERIIENDFDLLSQKTFKTISKKYEITLKEVQHLFDLITTLNPRPGQQYETREQPKYIVPDLMVQKINGDWLVGVNDEFLPQLTVNRLYQRALKKEANDYLEEKMKHCQWLIRSIDYRKKTLVGVMEEIVTLQQSFFLNGPEFLKPLTLKMIAQRLQVHESTVSRATKDKYVQTPFGLYELKHFFSQGVATVYAEDKSSKQVHQVLQKLVDGEDKRKPLSDQKLTTIMKKDYHIDISRRTVAKYRDILGIPSSSMRKRYD